jgi:hypothetical protein
MLGCQMNRTHHAWAIDTNSKERHGLIGQWWWFTERHPNIPIHMQGTEIALFPTRKEARCGLPAVKRAFPKARVVKVFVTIKVAT